MKLKVCGMREFENITSLCKLKPNYIGFIFWAPSERHVTDNTPKIDDTIKISKNLFKKTDLTDFLITSATFIFVANPIRRDNSCKNIVAKIDKIIAQIKE